MSSSFLSAPMDNSLNSYFRTNVGPIRTRFNRLVGNSHAMHGTRKGLKKPPTAEELDKELDAFMVDSRSLNVSTEGGAATTGTSVADQDAEMA